MEKVMRELYGDGLAIHAGPESCDRVREGAGDSRGFSPTPTANSCSISADGGTVRLTA
jgi:hypothetical protein